MKLPLFALCLFILACCTHARDEPEKFLGPYPVCTRGAYMKDRCNICICPAKRTFYECSSMMCGVKTVVSRDETNWVEKISEPQCTDPTRMCVPECRYYYYCNICVCLKEGTGYVCSEKNCDVTIWNKNGTLKTAPDHVVAGFGQICEFPSKVTVYCNTCKCVQRGTEYSCSKNYCDEKLWYLNGTMKPLPVKKGSPNAGTRIASFFLITYSIPIVQIIYLINYNLY